jgi:hypothetical protein
MANDPKQRQQHPDSDGHKGAEEDTGPTRPGERPQPHGSLTGQFGHSSRDKRMEDLADGGDSDFPEAGQNVEHSGEPGKNP